MKKQIFAVAVALAVVVGVASSAFGFGGPRATFSDASARPATETISHAFASFGQKPSSAEDLAQLNDVRTAFADPQSSNPAARADFASARAVPIANAAKSAWLAPSGDRVCVYIPDPVDGFGAGCLTLEDIHTGHGFSFLGSSRSSYVVALVPDGDPVPEVTSARDPDAKLATTGNASAGLLPGDAIIRTAHATIDLANGAGPIDRPAP